MKRQITNLEQRLLDKGFYLDQKFYIGKHSEKIGGYIYKKDPCEHTNNCTIYVELDNKREDCVNIYIKKGSVTFDKDLIKQLDLDYDTCIDYIQKEEEKPLIEEVTEIVSRDNDENN